MPDAQLRETRWVPRQLAGPRVAVPADAREPYLLLRANGTAEGNGSGNRFRAAFSARRLANQRSAHMSTRMACAAIATENGLIRTLGQSNTYHISGDTLRLFIGKTKAALKAAFRAVSKFVYTVKS